MHRQDISIASVVFGENLVLNNTKNKEIILDYMRKRDSDPVPLRVNRECVEYVQSFKFLCVHLSENLFWSASTTA